MKKTLAAAALAASALAGMAAVAAPAPASAQVIIDYGRPYYGPVRGPGWDGYRRGYYARWHRYPVRVCGPHGRCWWR